MPDFTGSLGDKLTAISDKLVAAVPGIEGPIIAELHADIVALIQAEKDGISQAGSQVLKLEEPVIVELKAFNANVDKFLSIAQKFEAFAGGFSVVPIATAKSSDS